jgi:hypothetical protein
MEEELEKNEYRSWRTSANTVDMPTRLIHRTKSGIDVVGVEMVRLVGDVQPVLVDEITGGEADRQPRIWTRSWTRSGRANLQSLVVMKAGITGTVNMAPGEREERGRRIWMPVSWPPFEMCERLE